MTKITIKTVINSTIEDVFNNARNIDLHVRTMRKTNEQAIEGKTSGLISLGESVTWTAKHFGIKLYHKSLITEMKFPNYFIDKMVKGHFKTFEHRHTFNKISESSTMMTDIIEYQLPFHVFGVIIDKIFLKKYLTKILTKRTLDLKKITENNETTFFNS